MSLTSLGLRTKKNFIDEICARTIFLDMSPPQFSSYQLLPSEVSTLSVRPVHIIQGKNKRTVFVRDADRCAHVIVHILEKPLNCTWSKHTVRPRTLAPGALWLFISPCRSLRVVSVRQPSVFVFGVYSLQLIIKRPGDSDHAAR